MMVETDHIKPSLTERVAILQDELMLAIKWDRPCLSFAIYRSEFLREDIQSRLRSILFQHGNKLRTYWVDKAHYDIALELRDRPDRDRTVYWIDGLQWGGGRGRTDTYHALNMHREYLIEGKIRSVFWMTRNEARFLARHAPDFWAFRSSVVEFLDLPTGSRDEDAPVIFSGYEQEINATLALLNNNPNNVHLLKKLVQLYRGVGCFEDALVACKKLLRQAPLDIHSRLEIGEIYLELGRPETAARSIDLALRMKPEDPRIKERLENLLASIQREKD